MFLFFNIQISFLQNIINGEKGIVHNGRREGAGAVKFS